MAEKWTFTDQHKAQVPEWNERWIRFVMSTEPIDFDKTAAAVVGMYKAAELDTVDLRLVHCDSAIMGAIVYAYAAAFWQLPAADREKALLRGKAPRLETQTADNARRTLLGAISVKPKPLPKQRMRGPVSAPAPRKEPMVWQPLDHIVRQMIAGVESVFTDDALKTIRPAAKETSGSFAPYNGGSEWASWCCFLSFVRDVIGWRHESHKNYKFYEDAAIFGGPRWMHERFCLLCERALIRSVEGTRLHRDDGPAIAWRCGTCDWYLHGVRVDQQIVMTPETQTVQQINREQNADVKNLRIERFGWERYLQESGSRVIDQRFNQRDQNEEHLYETAEGPYRFAFVDPSTGRRGVLGVPRDIDNCQAAQDWLSHGLDSLASHRS